MFKFYIGDLNLQHKNIQLAGEVAGGKVSKYLALNDPAFFDRFLHQVMYFYAKPEVIKNPITALFANGYLQSVHPGTSRLLGPYLAKAESVPCLGVFNRDLHLKQSLDEYLFNYSETEDYFYTREDPSPNSFHYKKEDTSVTDQGWFDREPVRDVVYRLIWSKEPNIEWYDKDYNFLYKNTSNSELGSVKFIIDDFNEFWQTLIEIAKS